MAYGKRKASGASRPFGFSKKRKAFKRSYRPRPRASLATQGRDKLFVKCRRIDHLDVTANTTYGIMKFTDITNSTMFMRYASLYNYFRIKKMSVHFNATSHVQTALSVVSLDDQVQLTDPSQYMIQRSLYVHNMRDETKPHGRSLKMSGSRYSDWIPCEAVATEFSTNRAFDASIKYAFSCLHQNNQSVSIVEDYLVEFCGTKELMGGTLNPPVAFPAGVNQNP